MELKEINEKIKECLPEIERKYKVKSLGVFGSFARNEQKKVSDVDILVEFSEPVGFFTFLELEYFLEDILGRKVDLVTREALKPAIGKYILQGLKPIYAN